MIKVILLLFFTSYSLILSSQCPPIDDIELYSQEDINMYSYLFPKCTEIKGSLTIMSFDCTDRVKNINGLKNIRTIQGNLVIANNPELQNLEGFNNIIEVKGEIELYNNNKIKSVLFKSLKKVGSFKISDNNNLSNISSISLDSVKNRCNFGDNKNLKSIQLPSLNNGIDLAIKNNPKLKLIYKFDKISTLRHFHFENNSLISEINFLPKLKEVTEFLYFNNCDKLLNVKFLENITNIKRISISKCKKLLSIILSNNIKNLESINISQNEELTSIVGCNVLKLDIQNVNILANKKLNELNIFNSVENINNLNISGNSLSKVSCFQNLKNISNNFDLTDNRKLITYDVFENLISVGKHLRLEYNTEVTEFNNFKKLKYINGALNISGHYKIDSINGFDSLLYIGNNLMITDNHELLRIGNFPQLKEIGGTLFISHCDVLNEVIFLNLNKIGKDFSLHSLNLKENHIKMLQLNEIKGDINFGNTNFKNLDFLINLKKIRGFVQLKVE
ncbi:MAG: leucine-rich repeat protein [Saprospiraceae bacterium]|nr:leucine-rich repeat protein [Saprospiraceae bacterium]